MYPRIAAGALLLAAAAALWFLVPDGTFTVDGLTEVLAPLRRHWWGPLVSGACMAVLLTLLVPMTPQVAALVLAHGPAIALFTGVAGVVLSAGVGHVAGRFVLRHALGQRLGKAMPAIALHLQRRNLRATFAIRLMPGAPFSLMNALAGSAGVPLGYFLAGTALTAFPIVGLMVWLADGVIEALRSPDPTRVLWWGGGAVVLIVAAVVVTRRLRRKK